MIHPIKPTTAKPEYNLFKLHRKYDNQIIFVGYLSPQDLTDKNSKYIRNYVKKVIKELAPDVGYNLSFGHSINPQLN